MDQKEYFLPFYTKFYCNEELYIKGIAVNLRVW